MLTGNRSIPSAPHIYTEDELLALTIAQIKALAGELGYTITASRKAEIIAEFLEQQEAS